MAEEELCTMFVTVKHNPTPLQPAPLHFPYDLQADQLVKTIKGLNNCGEAKLCFLCEEPCVFQWKDPPPSLSPFACLCFHQAVLHH